MQGDQNEMLNGINLPRIRILCTIFNFEYIFDPTNKLITLLCVVVVFIFTVGQMQNNSTNTSFNNQIKTRVGETNIM